MYAMNGRRDPGGCSSPVFGDSFSGALNVILSSVGNLGILFTQTVGGTSLNYSQLTATNQSSGLHIVSGTPIRTINGLEYGTQIEVTFTANGFSGTETFTRPTCTDRYAITGTR